MFVYSAVFKAVLDSSDRKRSGGRQANFFTRNTPMFAMVKNVIANAQNCINFLAKRTLWKGATKSFKLAKFLAPKANAIIGIK